MPNFVYGFGHFLPFFSLIHSIWMEFISLLLFFHLFKFSNSFYWFTWVCFSHFVLILDHTFKYFVTYFTRCDLNCKSSRKQFPELILLRNTTQIITIHKRCSWCNGYRRRKWTRRYEFKSWTRLIAFHIALIPKIFSLSSSALVRQLLYQKENSEFKPVKLHLKSDLVSYRARVEGLVNMDTIELFLVSIRMKKPFVGWSE